MEMRFLRLSGGHEAAVRYIQLLLASAGAAGVEPRNGRRFFAARFNLRFMWDVDSVHEVSQPPTPPRVLWQAASMSAIAIP